MWPRILRASSGSRMSWGVIRKEPHFRPSALSPCPTTVLLDADGDIVRRFDGEVSADQLETELEQLLEGTL